MDSTSFEVEEIFGDILKQGTISPEQITELINFLAKLT